MLKQDSKRPLWPWISLGLSLSCQFTSFVYRCHIYDPLGAPKNKPKYAQTNQIFHCPCSDRVARGHHGCISFMEHPCLVILFTLCLDSPYVTSLIPKAHSGPKNRPKYAKTNQTNPFNSMSMLKQGSRRPSWPEISHRRSLSCQLISFVSGWPIGHIYDTWGLPQNQRTGQNTPKLTRSTFVYDWTGYQKAIMGP